MHKGIIAYAAVFVILVVAWWLLAGFKVPFGAHTSTTTIAGTNTVQPAGYPCVGAYLTTQTGNSTVNETCSWVGGNLGVWTASGNLTNASVMVVGQDGKTYVNATFDNPCVGLYNTYSLPAQNYTVTLSTGLAENSPAAYGCGSAILQLNVPQGNLSAPNTNIVNGNFMTGTYYGWTSSGKAWGAAPLNITKANADGCYPQATQWLGYNGTYFASTYQCGYGSHATGNLTSMPFITSKSFLNFQVLGSGGAASYVEILYNGSIYIRARFSTANMSNTRTGSFVFTNATLPLFSARNRLIQVRIVANETDPKDFLAVGGFWLGSTPVQTRSGVLVNITIAK